MHRITLLLVALALAGCSRLGPTGLESEGPGRLGQEPGPKPGGGGEWIDNDYDTDPGGNRPPLIVGADLQVRGDRAVVLLRLNTQPPDGFSIERNLTVGVEVDDVTGPIGSPGSGEHFVLVSKPLGGAVQVWANGDGIPREGGAVEMRGGNIELSFPAELIDFEARRVVAFLLLSPWGAASATVQLRQP